MTWPASKGQQQQSQQQQTRQLQHTQKAEAAVASPSGQDHDFLGAQDVCRREGAAVWGRPDVQYNITHV